MKNLEIGNYIRAGTAGIKKITAITKDVTGTIKNIIDEKGLFINVKYIQQAENTIMDLIKHGDYINGQKVYRIIEPALINDYKKMIYCNECEGVYGLIISSDKDIKDVLTKEQFDSRKFKVR